MAEQANAVEMRRYHVWVVVACAVDAPDRATARTLAQDALTTHEGGRHEQVRMDSATVTAVHPRADA